MSEKVDMTEEFLEKLVSRIEAIEERLAEKETRRRKHSRREKDEEKDWVDSLGDAIDRSTKDTGRVLKGMVEATAEALNETADALSSMSEETDKDKLGELPAAVVSVLRRGIEIQKKALEKFEESCAKKRDEDDD